MTEPSYPFPEELTGYYTHIKWVPGIGWAGVHRLMFHWTVHYGIDDYGYSGRYCYATQADAIESLAGWTGEGDAPGRWHKHPPTGRRRDPDTGEVWHESVLQPSVQKENEHEQPRLP